MAGANSPDKADGQRAAEVLRVLEELSSEEYTILKVSEPISSAVSSANGGTNGPAAANSNSNKTARTSDVSTSSLDAPTPSSLEADLAHYRELFAKLRFSYVEQVTKEKFIRAIVGDPPLIVAPHENAELEARNAAAKAALKGLKAEVAALVADLDARGRELARRYEAVQADARRLAEMPARIDAAERRVAELRRVHTQQLPHQLQPQPSSADPAAAAAAAAPDMEIDELGNRRGAPPEEMRLPLGRTLALVDARKRELAALARQAELLANQAPRKRREAERLAHEVTALEARRAHSAAAAAEAKRRRTQREQKGERTERGVAGRNAAGLQGGGREGDGEGGSQGPGAVEDEMEARGRWYRASEAVLRRVLDLDAEG